MGGEEKTTKRFVAETYHHIDLQRCLHKYPLFYGGPFGAYRILLGCVNIQDSRESVSYMYSYVNRKIIINSTEK